MIEVIPTIGPYQSTANTNFNPTLSNNYQAMSEAFRHLKAPETSASR